MELFDDGVDWLRMANDLQERMPFFVREPGGGWVRRPLQTLYQILLPLYEQLVLLSSNFSFSLGQF